MARGARKDDEHRAAADAAARGAPDDRDTALSSRQLRLTDLTAPDFVRSVLRSGGELWLPAVGQSMWPTIRHGARVLIAAHAEPKAGRVALVDLCGCLTLHRVVEARAGTVRTAGDAVSRSDAPAPAAAIVGVAVAADHGGRVTALVPTTRFGAIALLRGVRAWLRMRATRAYRRLRGAR
jgi:hypothetical protein